MVADRAPAIDRQVLERIAARPEWDGVPVAMQIHLMFHVGRCALQDAAVPDFTYFQQGHIAGLFDHRDAGAAWKYWVDSRSGHEQAFDLRADKRAVTDVIASVPSGLKHQWRQRYVQILASGTGVLERPE
jgi:hypothetical protein